MSILNTESWTPIEVADWISGLDINLSGYGSIFLDMNVSGHLLINLMAGDLNKYGVHKIGDQLLLQDAILTLRNELDIDRVTLQTLSSSLAIRCRNYRSELSLTKPIHYSSIVQNNYIPTESLSSASYLLDSAKVLIRWLTRFPFIGTQPYDQLTVKLTRHCFELAMLSQRDSFADNAIEEVQYLCTKIIEICEGIIHSKDSLIIQPAAVDVITLRKRTEQELGLSLESSYFGLHQVLSVKLNSACQQSGHMEKGDEILQVNYQTVLGWPQLNLVNLLHENSNEVILTIKRRPRHATTNMLTNMYLRPKPIRTIKIVSPVLESDDEMKLLKKQEQKLIEENKFWKLYPKRNLIKRRVTVTGASPTSTRPPVTFVNSRPPLINSISAPDKILSKEIILLYTGQLHLRQTSNPRWTRYKCTLDNQLNIQIGNIKNIKLKDSKVTIATEVHSRPFAFKIEHDATSYYLAAESQLEFDSWIKLINEDLVNNIANKRANYKRSVSLGNSPSSKYLSSVSLNQMRPKLKKPIRSSSIKTCALKSEWLNNPIRLSQSTSKLLQEEEKSNISSITITSLRKMIEPIGCPSCAADKVDNSTQTENNSLMIFFNSEEEKC